MLEPGSSHGTRRRDCPRHLGGNCDSFGNDRNEKEVEILLSLKELDFCVTYIHTTVILPSNGRSITDFFYSQKEINLGQKVPVCAEF